MNYQDTINYLYNCYPMFEHVGGSAYKEGLGNSLALDEHFGHPHLSYKTIHVAGTNGKGSCSHSIAAILQNAGYKVGLYTSPHLVDFRERIRVDGVCISERDVTKFVESEKAFFEPLHPSFFELTTALALLYFKQQKVDIAVIEVGLGGRLDCTNIISPILSVITNISFDHTQFLGNTLAKIAGEKAGIIKDNTPVVVGEATPETRPVFEAVAKRHDAEIFFAEDAPEVRTSKPCVAGGRDYDSKSFGFFHGELSGAYQTQNTNTVLSAINVLRGKIGDKGVLLNITDNNVINGLANITHLTHLMGRWQQLADHPKTICDIGHNVAGWECLAPQIKTQKYKTLRMVFGMVDDKDVDGVMAMLPKDAVYYWTQASTKRAIAATKIGELGKKHGLKGQIFDNVGKAYHEAKHDADADDFLFIGGSNYIVADLLRLNDF